MLIYCLKCRSKTATDDEVLNGNTAKGKCSVCGTNKHTFVSARQEGKGEIDAKLAKEAYNKKPKEDIDGYKLDKQLSAKSGKTLVYANDNGQVKIAHRGTNDGNDLKNDALLALGLLDKSKRVQNAKKITAKATEKYKDSTISHTAHSLGSAVAQEVLKDKNVSVKNSKLESFNGAATPTQLTKNVYNKVKCSVSNSTECKKLKNQTFNTTGVDPISMGNLVTAGDVKLVKPNQINVHGIDNFVNSGGCSGVKTCKCRK